MKSIFEKHEGKYLKGERLRNRILEVLQQKKYASTSDLYRACSNHVYKSDLHPMLLKMINDKEIGMEVIAPNITPQTRFFLLSS